MLQERSKVTQALITVGGQGNTLRRAGIDVPLSKSFLEVEGKPILYWCIQALLNAGVRKFIIAAETQEKLTRAANVIEQVSSGYDVQEVVLFRDSGFGPAGLPFHVRKFLSGPYFFQFGHTLDIPQHYRNMGALKHRRTQVYSDFSVRGLSPRPHKQVFVDESTNRLRIRKTKNTRRGIIGPPYLFDSTYALMLPIRNFNPDRIRRALTISGNARSIRSILPIEVDVPTELYTTVPVLAGLIFVGFT